MRWLAHPSGSARFLLDPWNAFDATVIGEGWVEVQNASLAVTPWAWVFYVSFVLIAVFVVVNLFIAVVLNNLERARHETSHAPSSGA